MSKKRNEFGRGSKGENLGGDGNDLRRMPGGGGRFGKKAIGNIYVTNGTKRAGIYQKVGRSLP